MNTPKCPDEQSLASFVDGTLDAAGRRAMFEHLGDCAECRDVVTTARELHALEAAGDGVRVPPVEPHEPRPWMVPLIALAAAAAIAFLFLAPIRNALTGPSGMASLERAAGDLKFRRVEGRLAGAFAYRPMVSATRSANARKTDESEVGLYETAARIQKSASDDDADSLHNLGVAYLLVGDADNAVAQLERAQAKTSDPDKLDSIATDLAAALLARGGKGDAQRARLLSEKQLAAHATPEAAWNRALAIEKSGDDAAARAAWDDYLRLDRDSPWAGEASKNRDDLR